MVPTQRWIKALAEVRRIGVHEGRCYHQLKFKGPGFDFDAKGWLGIAAAVIIVLLVLFAPSLGCFIEPAVSVRTAFGLPLPAVNNSPVSPLTVDIWEIATASTIIN
jgi:hypothetical protein